MNSPTQHAGLWAEELAARHLAAQGLKEVSRNYRCAMGEIDLIMTEGATLVFVEVRYRANTRFGRAEETVGYRKQQRLIKAAQHFLQTRRDSAGRPCRFDVVAISGADEQRQIDWIKGAFQT